MRLLPPVLVCLAVLTGTAVPASAVSAAVTDAALEAPPAQPVLDLGTALPPGNSGFFSVPGQARGSVTGDPGDYGEHVDDQRVMFWDGDYKDGRFKVPAGKPQTPKDGVRLYEDEKGVPVVYGDTAFDVWFGAGYAAGQQRLFLADAVRRLGRGTFAELVGPSGVPADALQRTLTYSQAEYDAMLAALPEESQQVFEGYAAGMDAWIQHVRTNPADLPAEYALLSTLPERWTVTDSLAAGVLITRTVASAGGNEFDNVGVLRALQESLGADEGLAAFGDVRWQSDEKAAVTVPPEEGRFDNAVVPAAQRDEVFRRSAEYALSLPPELADDPSDAAPPSLPDGVAPPELPLQVQASLRGVAETLVAWGEGLHGGSFALHGSRVLGARRVVRRAAGRGDASAARAPGRPDARGDGALGGSRAGGGAPAGDGGGRPPAGQAELTDCTGTVAPAGLLSLSMERRSASCSVAGVSTPR